MELTIPKTWQSLLFFIVITMLLTMLSFSNTNDKILIDRLLEKYSQEEVEKTIENVRVFRYFIPLIQLVFYFIKCSLIAFVIQLGLLLLEIKQKFKLLFQIAVFTNLIFLLPNIVSEYYSVFEGNESPNVINLLSVSHFINPKNIDPLIKPLIDLLNVFELAFWLLLSYFMGKLLHFSFLNSFKIVASTYGIGLFIWIAFECYLVVSTH